MRRQWGAVITVQWGAVGIAVAVLAIAIAVVASSGSSANPQIAYVSAGPSSEPEVWVAGDGGASARRLGPGSEPLIAPDGSMVAASSVAGESALTLYRASTRSGSSESAHRFFSAARTTARARAWSPDSRYLAVVLSSTDPASDAGSGLAVIDARTDTYRVIAHGPIEGAGFAPGVSDRIVYGAAASTALSAPVNIHIATASGTDRTQITHDGRSLNPVWGPDGIAFDHERLRRSAAPAYEIFSMKANGSARRALTDLAPSALMDGLVPLAFSADGTRLLAEYEGQDTSQAWTITIASQLARELLLGGHSVAGAGISRDGGTVLVDRGGFLYPPGHGVVQSLSFTGGRARVLIAHGSQPSWTL